MISDVLSEDEFKKRLAFWLLDNDKAAVPGDGVSREEYAENYRLPEFDYVHTQSFADENGDLISLLKSEVRLRDWETRSGKAPKSFTFYLVLKTSASSPETEPFPMGYIIVL